MNTDRRTWIVLLGGATIVTLGLWLLAFAVPAPQSAFAQVPDAGLQRQQMLEELRTSNVKLDELAKLLREIRDARQPDEKKPAAPAAKPAPVVKPAPVAKPAPTAKPARK